MNHLASCAPPFCSCHPPQHICHWEKKKNQGRKPHPDKLLHDTKDHFFKLKFICSPNMGFLSPWAHTHDCRNPHTGGKWRRLCLQTLAHARTQAHLFISSKTIRFLHVGSMVPPIPPRAISGLTHATAGQDPNAYQIITFQPTTPAWLSQLL